MKLLILSDTQIGATTVDLADQRAVLDRIIAIGLERNVDLVLHAGDVFEGAVVTPEHLRCFLDGTAPLREAGIPMCIALGNGKHDSSVRAVHALDVLRDIDGFDISDRPKREAYGEINVCTLPYVPINNLIAKMDGKADHASATELATKMLVGIARDLYAPGVPSVLLAHWFIDNTSLPTGLPVDQMHEPVLPWADLDAIGYDAIIAGHNHHGQQISRPLIDSTLGIVVGSPQPLNHGEAGYEHGCWIIEVNDALVLDPPGRVIEEFVPIESRQFATIDYNDTGWNFDDGAIVRVRYTASEDEARRIDHEQLRRTLIEEGASKVTIEPTIIRKERARAQQISESLSPVDALAEFCEANDVEPDRALAMLARLKEWSEA